MEELSGRRGDGKRDVIRKNERLNGRRSLLANGSLACKGSLLFRLSL